MSLTIAQAEASSASGLAVADTAGNIAQGLIVAPDLVARVTSFTLSANGAVSASAASRLAAIGAQFQAGGFVLTVQDTIANITLAGNAGGVALAGAVVVSDTAYDLLNAASARFAHVSSVVLTGSPVLSIAQLAKLEALPHFSIAPAAVVILTDTVGNVAAALSSNIAWFNRVSAISLRLDGGHIGAYTAGLLNGMMQNGKHISFVPTPGDATLNISAAAHDMAANAAALNGLAARVPLAFALTNPAAAVTAADAASLIGLAGFASHLPALAVMDSGAHVAANAAALFSHTLAGITVTSGIFSGTVPQLLAPALHLQGATAALAASATVTAMTAESLASLPGFTLGSGVQLTIADSLANVTAPLNSDGYAVASGFTILDNGVNLAAAAAQGWGMLPASYVLTSSSAVSALQLAALAGLGQTFLRNSHLLTLTDSVAGVLGATSPVRAFADAVVINDVSSNVTTAALNLLNGTITAPLTIGLNDSGHVSVTTATYTADINVIDDIVYNGLPDGLIRPAAVTVAGSAAAILGIAPLLSVDPHVGNAAITDTAAALTDAAFDALHGNLFVTLGITLSDPQDAVRVTAATYATDTVQVDALQNAASLQVTGSAAGLAPLAATLASDYRITGVVLTDSAAGLDAVAASFAPVAGKLTIALTNGGVVGATTLGLLANSAGLTLAGPLTLAANVAGVTGLSPLALGFANSVVITDVAGSLTSTALDTLQNTVAAKLTSIQLTGPGLVTIGAATYAADRTVIDKIANPGAVTVTGVSSALDGIAAMLKTDTVVGSIVASDTAANIVGDIANLLNVGAKLSVTLTDALPIAAGLVPQLALLPVTNAAHAVVADSGANLAAVVEAASTATAAFLNAARVQLSANSVVAAADAKALEGLTSFSNAGFKLAVWDTVAHLTSGLYTAAIGNSVVSGLYLNTNGLPVSLSAANMLALLALPHFHDTNPDGSPNSITISDTAAHLSSAFATLAADAAQLAGVAYAINASATVSEATLGQLQSLGAVPLQGAGITVRDTASNIAVGLAAQQQSIGFASVTPIAYALSGSSVVSRDNAAILGLQSNFSAGPYTLTIVQTTKDIVSIGGANDLGNLGNSLIITGGGQLMVAGTLSEVSALNAGARAIVAPLISDSLANLINPITGLTASSTLLGGTLTITDSESVSAFQASCFFGLIRSGGPGGIAAANVSFGSNIETVTGNVAALEHLTALPAWAQNATLTAAFPLTASDTVAALIDSDNTSFLSGIAATELAGLASTDAASAEQLAMLKTQIHYQAAASSLTVADTVVNLLNANYADGMALANSVALTADGSTNAAGAEALLGNPKFTLTHVLTIEDTPQNLLDATLGHLLTAGAYGSNVLVELNAPTVTDASTAAALVGLPGFADPLHQLTISDHPGFLIDSSYLGAETAAAIVTIPGDEIVSTATVLRLSEVPHFTPGSSHLILAANDVADDATLAAIGNFGASFQVNGHSITMTQDDTTLTQAQFSALQNDNVVTNGHLFSAIAPVVSIASVSEGGNSLDIQANSSNPAAFNSFDASGAPVPNSSVLFSSTVEAIHMLDGNGNFSLTETLGNAVSNPIILLDASSLTSALGAGSFSTTPTPGAVAFSIGGGPTDYLPIYTAGAVPNLTAPALVFDPLAHTLSLDVHTSTVLITLGGTTMPSSITASEIYVKNYGATHHV